MPTPPDIKQFSGIMNTDDPNEVIGANQHKIAFNVRFQEGRAEGINGTVLLTNTYLPATGTNECIGAFYDQLKQRIISFNYNSGGLHAIFLHNLKTGAWSRVALVGYNTDGDILGFTLEGVIYDAKILYGDEEQGDILYFNNSQKQPCKINIDRALSGGYGTIKRSFINVAKEPPLMPPAVVYGDDGTVTVNNLRKKLFKFSQRNHFDDLDKSVPSTHSEVPLPVNYTDTAIDKDPTKNCKISIVIPTGAANVKKLEILGSAAGKSNTDGTVDPNVFSDFFSIVTLDKAALSIPDNDLYTYTFFNNEVYDTIDQKEATQLYDLVPLEANALEFLNGNVPIYAGIKEGYNPATLLGSVTSASTISARSTQYPFIFLTNQSGDSGFGTGNIHAVLIGAITVGQIFNIYTTNETISFTATVATTSNVITGLSAAAVTLGFTAVSSDTENLVITKTGESLLRSLATNINIAVGDSFVYDWNSRYDFAIEYEDAQGRSCGGVKNPTMSVQTANYTETTGTPNIPKIPLSISSRPPIEAVRYKILRSRNLSKLNFIYWVTDRTYKDSEFAYIGIENLNRFIKENPSSGYLAYSFSTNDRIRFVKKLSGTSSIYTNEDFEIQGQVFNPEINGIVQEGQYLKISLPATSGSFDFGTYAFFNYFIQLYTPALSVSEGLNFYYEFGERYAIGNAGTVNAFHQGMIQNQTPDLVTPATFEFTKGDFYYRNRVIQTGGDFNYTLNAGNISAGRHTLGATFIDRSFTDANITTGSSPLQDLSSWTFASSSRALIIMGGSAPTTTFKAKGTVTVDPLYGANYRFFFQDKNGLMTYVNAITSIGEESVTQLIDCSFSLNASNHISALGWSDPDFSNAKTFSATELKITVDNPFTVGIIDPNFSDYFESGVNSNGRAWIVDPNAAQVYNPTALRWGLSYQINTNINQSNRFYPLNFDEVDRSKGDILRMKVREMMLLFFQSRGVGQKGIYSKFLQSKDGANIITTTDEIITPNNVNYYDGEYGLGNQPTSLVSGKSQDYFADPVRGYHVRRAADGLTPISELYKGEFYIRGLITPFNNTWTRTGGGNAKILGCYDYLEEQYMCFFQGGVNGEQTILASALSFNEKRNGYCSFYDTINGGLAPEWVLSAEEDIYMWKNGQMYVQNDAGASRTLLGDVFYPSVTPVFNKDIAIKKTYKVIGYQSNRIFVSDTNGDIKTSAINTQTGLQQISQLKSVDYEVEENLRYANFLQDANSRTDAQLALLEGDDLTGVWIECKLIYKGSDSSYLYLPYIEFQLSPRNM